MNEDRGKKKRRRPRRKTPWCQKHAERIDEFPSMEHLVEWMRPYGDMAANSAEVISEKHRLNSTISSLIALREVINERIAMEARIILEKYRGDDVADVKILIWEITNQARQSILKDNEKLIPHLADGLHPQNAEVLDGVKLNQLV